MYAPAGQSPHDASAVRVARLRHRRRRRHNYHVATTSQESTMPTDPPNFTGPADTTESVEATAELAHLHPDNLRLGGTGVFAGDWAWTDGPDGSSRIAVGFVGVLIDTWNGWAVFRCSREVAEAIGADQPGLRRRHHRRRPARHVRRPGGDRADHSRPGRPVRRHGLELVLGGRRPRPV